MRNSTWQSLEKRIWITVIESILAEWMVQLQGKLLTHSSEDYVPHASLYINVMADVRVIFL